MSNECDKSGDVVKLKSGGPAMTITVLRDGYAMCSWFDENGKVHSRDFPVEALEECNVAIVTPVK
jgi:uncharacterized protein YodC (DUF2158 family)